MKQYNYIYDTQDAFLKYIDSLAIEKDSSTVLIQLFSSQTYKQIQNNLTEILEVLPHATLIGTSTAGEIIAGKMINRSTVLSISVFQKSKINAFYAIEKDSYKLGLTLSKKVFHKDTKCVISFLDGLGHNGQEYLLGLNSMNFNKAVIAGGMAADMLDFQKTYTIFGNKIFSGGAVCVALEGEDLEVLQDYNLGWHAVGPTFVITKSEGARVYEIDNRPIKDIYAEVLGEFAVENMPASTIEFPLILENDDMLIARSMLSVAEDGSILYGGNIEEGSVVRFGIGSRTLVNQYNPKEQLKASEALQACFIYSCIARKMFLEKDLEKTFRVIENTAPTSGFFTYGEFFFYKQQTKLLNITTTLLFLREKGTQTLPHHPVGKDNIYNASKTDSALFNLIEYVTRELKEQERGFRASKFKLDEFLKALESSVIISRTDTDGIITYVNEQFEKISGYTREELLGKAHSIIRDPNTSDALFAQMWETITKGKIWKGEFSNRAKDGSIYHVKCSIIPIHDENSNVIEYMAIREDVTSLVESRKKAEEAGAAQAMFLANMSHEIRTPMNGILGFSELLAKTDLDATQEKYVKVIGSSTKILLEIVNDILDSSKITNKKIVLEKIHINPFEEFMTTYELLKTAAQEKSINYTIEIDEKISKCILSDAMRLRQIKINLLSNAIKFTPKFGEVAFKVSLIKTEKKKQTLRFSVEDSGIGIPKSKIKEIFKPFSQADASTTRKFGGTGLGLSISSDLIKAFDSELKVTSQEGKGSKFYFEMTFDLCEERELEDTESTEENVCQKDEDCDRLHLKVLVAEDYEVNRMLIESIFQKYKNITLDFAVNGRDALDKLKEQKYDLILMDINMPVLNGIDATKYVREKLHLDIPIVALTANALEGDKEKFLQCGMNDYLSKPIDVTALENILCKYSKTDNEMGLLLIEEILESLKSKIGLREAVSVKLLRTFLESLKEEVPELEEAIKLKNITQIYKIVHKLKGAASALYISDISELMSGIEKDAEMKILRDYELEIDQMYMYIKTLENGLSNII
ncbi:FIST N-terminal domain-containing protein [Sulfurimonas sp. NWX79]|uniref:FIST N-terminal domain-containing protein n=1 Tax=Sulfurimonas sp. NWX79 TaxID=2925412 RepID=UPI0032049D2C